MVLTKRGPELPLTTPVAAPKVNGVGSRQKKKNVRLQGRMRSLHVIINFLSQPKAQLALSCLGPISVSLLFLGGIPKSPPGSTLQAMIDAYDSLIHFSVYLIITTTFLAACLLVFFTQNQDSNASQSKLRQILLRPAAISFIIFLVFTQAAAMASYQQVVDPGWLANPWLIVSGYKIYWPNDIPPAFEGLCLDYKPGETDRKPLCLPEESWDTLSSGALSSNNNEDVETVVKGLSYIQKESGGIVVSIMGRDVNEHIDTIRQNVENLRPFFPTISVVVFENDSSDGSREHFKEWKQDAGKGYEVNLLECPEAVDCKFGKSHRYDATEAKDFWTSSTVGEMHHYRQRVMDHILSSSQYQHYSHILQLDLDLGISISPLGVLHSLGQQSAQDTAIASSCRQPWPGSLGTLVPPYDFNAFESATTPDTQWLKWLHQKWCGVMPPGDRYRFTCEGSSPFKFFQIISMDRANKVYPYPVASAYNGATLYPIKLVRETNPKYDAGEDGQRCEHLSFNLGLKKHMLVNPKWNMHMSPTLPGGPKGEKALKFFHHYSAIPQVFLPLFVTNAIPLAILVFSVMTISVHMLSTFCFGKSIGTQRTKKRDA